MNDYQNNMQIIHCKNKEEASQKALEMILKDVDQDTLLLLSGGSSPDLLYQMLAKNKTLTPGAAAMIDERYGLLMHERSNEKMIANTGLLDYLNNAGIPFCGILDNSGMEEMASKYEQTIRGLFNKFPKKVAIMGIGSDGHTAGIKPGLEYDHNRFVVSYDDSGSFGKRVTLTFEALKEIDEFIILVFGESKKQVLEKITNKQNQQEFPAAFYNNSSKVTVFTDINF